MTLMTGTIFRHYLPMNGHSAYVAIFMRAWLSYESAAAAHSQWELVTYGVFFLVFA
jgi:hypothetical protein